MALEEKIEFGTASQMITKDEDFTLPGKEMLRVDLACGQTKKEGFVGIDNKQLDGVDVVHDLLQFPWPLKDDSVYEMNCEHFVEHIPIQLWDGSYGLSRFMEEVYRCLMPLGTIKIVAPHYMSMESYQDFTHCRAITDRTFMYFDQSITGKVGIDHYTGKCNFEQLTKTTTIGPEWNGKSDEARKFAMTYYWNVCKEISFVLRKKPLIVKEDK